MEVTVATEFDVMELLKGIEFNPSCVDMSWSWKIRTVYVNNPTHFGMTTGEPFPGVEKRAVVLAGWLISTTFVRPERETGKLETGHGREWFIATGTTLSGVVKTAFAACKMILEHELMESFKFDKVRPFDPHNSIDKLKSLQYQKVRE